jgi:hypothetical protein
MLMPCGQHGWLLALIKDLACLNGHGKPAVCAAAPYQAALPDAGIIHKPLIYGTFLGRLLGKPPAYVACFLNGAF